MRDLILQQYAVSLDGFSCADGSEFQKYVFGVDDPEMDELFIETLSHAGTHVMGRSTYLDMAQHWPTRTSPVASLMNGIPKVVFSRTLERADWPESRIARGDTGEEMAQLKEEPGGEIVAHGGFSFTQSLVKLGLVDELRLYVYPVALGHGTSVFGTVESLTEYELTLIKPFSSGAVLHVWRSVRSGSAAVRMSKGESGQAEFLSHDPPKTD